MATILFAVLALLVPGETGPMTPAEWLRKIVQQLHEIDPDDVDAVAMVGVGDLENLIRGNGEELWPEIDATARIDPVFRRALRSVWAYDSSEFDRREALLAVLGEFWDAGVRFVVEPEGFDTSPLLSWRALQTDGEVPSDQLARILREIADHVEREPAEGASPFWVNERDVVSAINAWRVAFDAVRRAAQTLLNCPDRRAFDATLTNIDRLRSAEADAWERLRV